MKATKTPSGKWRARAFSHEENGKKIYKSFTADTKSEAEYLANKFKFDRKAAPTVTDITLGEAIDGYIARMDKVLAPSTVRTYKVQRKGYFQPLMSVRLSKLTQSTLQAAVNREAVGRSPKTVRNAYSLVMTALGEHGIKFDIKLPKPVKTQMTIPTEAQIKALLEHVKGSYMEAVILIAANTGMRRSEICALTWNDLGEDTIRVNKAKVLDDKRQWVIKSPKSYEGTRTISVSKNLIAKIREIPRTGDEIVPVNPNSIDSRFGRLKEKLGFDFRFHDLRHYNASVMLALGIPDKYAMERLGQATPSVLRNVYQHLRDDTKKDIARKLNDHLSDMI